MSPLNKRGPKRRIEPLKCPHCGQIDCVICLNSAKGKFKCKSCGKIYNERTKTLFANKKTNKTIIVLCITLFTLGVPMAVISCATLIREDTLARWMREASKYCKNLHDKHIRNINAETIQFDELWSFSEKKANQMWVWSAIEGKTKLLIDFIVAPRESKYARVIVSKVAARLANLKVLITTDGYKPYIKAIAEFYPQAIYAQVVKKRKKGRVVEVLKKAISDHTIGLIEFNIRLLNIGWTINTAFIERLNLTMRRLVSCLARKTNSYSKNGEVFEGNVYMFAVYYNFIRPHSSLKIKSGDKTINRTPAMAAYVSNRMLSWYDVLRESPRI